jgi:hypothetical protein
MQPNKPPSEDRQWDLIKVELNRILDPSHSLVRLSSAVGWAAFEQAFGASYCSDTGSPD